MNKRGLALLAVAFLGGLSLAWFLAGPGRLADPVVESPTPVAERPRVDGDFTLLDIHGKTVRWSEISRGHQLVFFGFTHCPEACPLTLANATQALAQLGPVADRLQVTLISVDPARDTPEIMGRYIAGFGPKVRGYTSDEAGIQAAAQAFHVFYEKMSPMADGDYMINHTATLFFLGPDQEILEIIPYGATPEEITASVRRHLGAGTG